MDLPRPEIFDFHGVSMTHYFTDNWENVQNFKARPDDIVIATYPKAGTEMANTLSTSPRIIKTHLPVQFIPKSFWEQNCKIVYCARNAKDNVVSYFHFDRMEKLQPEPGDWTSFLQRFKEGKMVFGPWYDHVCGWWEKKQTYSKMHYMFFEDLVADTGREIKRLCSFLGLSTSDEEKEKIRGAVQFDVMKANPMTNLTEDGSLDFSVSQFLRKAPILKHPEPNSPFVVEAAASETGVGAVLSQHSGNPPKQQDGAFYSHKLSPAEWNYGIRERELLAVNLAL
ncbi:cytosolic sulfotransferase 2-like isoform X3 [Pygocentrus nattereri]|uniref:cytosolic sulfotransferase 2-like isoform X3 n=1 Tax=Pygocentrus nattereri TaxID=42514 RepID=UPI0008149955|nr:cytosolic sulfotransferase 2-like isoform X3 [Pygocentrus nattereri]